MSFTIFFTIFSFQNLESHKGRIFQQFRGSILFLHSITHSTRIRFTRVRVLVVGRFGTRPFGTAETKSIVVNHFVGISGVILVLSLRRVGSLSVGTKKKLKLPCGWQNRIQQVQGSKIFAQGQISVTVLKYRSDLQYIERRSGNILENKQSPQYNR